MNRTKRLTAVVMMAIALLGGAAGTASAADSSASGESLGRGCGVVGWPGWSAPHC